MSEIIPVPEKDVDKFITIIANAYPEIDLSSGEKRQKFKERLIRIRNKNIGIHYGLYREGILMGGMVFYDFIMNFYSRKILVGGVGLVAVDLLHKKEKVCKDMITYFLSHYKKKGACLTALYPFRPDFYRKMGFGFGTKMHQYRLSPSKLPKGTKEHVQFLDKNDKAALWECYSRYTEKTHGMMEKKEYNVERLFEVPEFKIVGYKRGEKILGYTIFTFKQVHKENPILIDIEIKEFIYENREVLSELLTFFHDQDDQIRFIIFNTQDDYFHHVFSDPRDGSDHIIPSVYHECHVSGVGIMYRVIDTEGLFKIWKDHTFGNETVKLCLDVRDSFFRENEKKVVVHFQDGIPFLGRKEYEVTVSLDVSDFSSLAMGCIPFRKLYEYGLAEISDVAYVDTVDKVFLTEEKPVCTTEF